MLWELMVWCVCGGGGGGVQKALSCLLSQNVTLLCAGPNYQTSEFSVAYGTKHTYRK